MVLSAFGIESTKLSQIITSNSNIPLISTLKDIFQFFYQLKIVLIKLHSVFFPKSLSVNRTPLKDIVINLSLIFIKIA